MNEGWHLFTVYSATRKVQPSGVVQELAYGVFDSAFPEANQDEASNSPRIFALC